MFRRVQVAVLVCAAIAAARVMADPAGEWTMPARDYASTRYSPLDEINASNAANLQLAFTWSTGIEKGHEAAPLVVGDTMYVVTPFPNHVVALDLAKPGANVKWRFDP